MDKKTKRLIGFTILITALVLVGVFTLDYFNVFSGLGLNIKNINWDATTLIAGNIVVILLFVITYFIVDSRSIQKDKNQRMTAHLTLVGIYERCKDMVDIFSQEDLRTRAAQKCDGDKLLHEDKSHMHFLNYPFENESIVYEFAGAGILSKTIFSEFITIKKHYQKYINVAIIFYDHYDQFKPLESEVSKELTTALETLKKFIDEDLEGK